MSFFLPFLASRSPTCSLILSPCIPSTLAPNQSLCARPSPPLCAASTQCPPPTPHFWSPGTLCFSPVSVWAPGFLWSPQHLALWAFWAPQPRAVFPDSRGSAGPELSRTYPSAKMHLAPRLCFPASFLYETLLPSLFFYMHVNICRWKADLGLYIRRDFPTARALWG